MVSSADTVLLAHSPKPTGKDASGKWIKAPRQESPDVRECVQEMPLVRAAFSKLVIWTKFEVLAVLNPGFHPSLIAAALQDMDDITVWSLDKRERIFAQQRLVDPPQIFILHPTTIPLNAIAKFASNFGDVTSVIPDTRAGSAVVPRRAVTWQAGAKSTSPPSAT